MKKLLLLLVIPFLSFGQCLDIQTEVKNKGVDGKSYKHTSDSFGLDHYHKGCFCDTKSRISLIRSVDTVSSDYDALYLALDIYDSESESVDFNVAYRGVVFFFNNNKSFELQVSGSFKGRDSIIISDADEEINWNKHFKDEGKDHLVREIKPSDYKQYSPFLALYMKSYEGDVELEKTRFYLNLLTKNLIKKIVINGYDHAEKPMENIYTTIEVNVNKKSAKKLRKQINCILKI